MRERTVGERFWNKVDLDGPGGCWLWTASGVNGYGRFTVNGKMVRSHRWAYESLVGPIPEGLQLDHLCRVPACVNPNHLEPVTGRENLMRGNTLQAANAAKTQCPYGHPYDGANTYRSPDGRRMCKACNRERSRRAYHAGRSTKEEV